MDVLSRMGGYGSLGKEGQLKHRQTIDHVVPVGRRLALFFCFLAEFHSSCSVLACIVSPFGRALICLVKRMKCNVRNQIAMEKSIA